MRRKVYKVKPNKKQMTVLREYWKQFKAMEDRHWGRVARMEESMSQDTGLEGLEFFMCDNAVVGIGNGQRTMRLIQREVLEK